MFRLSLLTAEGAVSVLDRQGKRISTKLDRRREV